jgi:thiazole synthase
VATEVSQLADPLVIGGVTLRSRLIHGTGKFAGNAVLAECLAAAEPDLITLAVRRLGLQEGESELGDIDLSGFHLLPNTAGATTVEQALRLARLARAAGLSDMVKVEVIGDDQTLLPDPLGTLEATRALVAEGFTVLPYTSDDVVQCLRLEEAGAAAVMPLAAPIGTTLGVLNPTNIRLIIERLRCPVIVDAGLGVPSDAARCMEWGASGVLVNTAIAKAADPPAMARAFAEGVRAGRRAYLAGPAHIGMERGGGGNGAAVDAMRAQASSPAEGLPGS